MQSEISGGGRQTGPATTFTCSSCLLLKEGRKGKISKVLKQLSQPRLACLSAFNSFLPSHCSHSLSTLDERDDI